MRSGFALYFAIRHVIGILLFPGVIVHEASHVLVCKVFGVRVGDVCYFKIGKGLGYVGHESAPYPIQDILIGLGPLLINPLVGFGLGALLLSPVWRHLLYGPLYAVYCWLGVSIATMGAPSMSDVSKAKELMLWSPSAIVRFFASGLIGIAALALVASVFLLDAVCGVLLFFAPLHLWK